MVKNKHKFLIAVAGVVFFVCVITFLFIKSSMNTKTFDDFIGNTNPDISKITMMDGGTGRSVFTTDKSKIKELLTILNNTQYRRASNQEGRSGFSYSYNFYVGDKLIMGMWDTGYMVNIYDTYYETTIEPRDGIKNWYNSIVASTTVPKK